MSFRLPGNATSLALTQSDERLLATLDDGVYSMASDGSALERLLRMDTGDESCSFNDSGCDAHGRLWIGSGSETIVGKGKLWVVSPSMSEATIALEGLSLANGIGFSPDSRFMYLVDSVSQVVHRIPYELSTGTIGEVEPFCLAAESDGLPDGLAVDVEGGVWIAFWDGGCVRRYTPDGSLHTEIPLPVSRVAGCAFGGPQLSDLYVTTASYELSGDERASQPLAGALFRIPTHTTGIPVARVPVFG